MESRDRCYNCPRGKCLPVDSLGMQSEQEAEGVISSILLGFTSALLLVGVFSFPFPTDCLVFFESPSFA